MYAPETFAVEGRCDRAFPPSGTTTPPASGALKSIQSRLQVEGEVDAGAEAVVDELLVLEVLVLLEPPELLSELDDADGAPPPSARLRLPPDLKSVSYQPPPLRRKPAADICLVSAGLPQAGQSVAGGSDMRWEISDCLPHSVQKYS